MLCCFRGRDRRRRGKSGWGGGGDGGRERVEGQME